MTRFTFFALFAAAILVCISANGQDFGRPPTFECTEDGYFADHYRNCQVFYKCENGNKFTMGCENGMRFDEVTKACLPAEHVSCPYPVPQ